MSADNLVLTIDSTRELAEQIGARARRQPVFWIALACAALVHAALIVGIGRSTPRTVGDPGGNANAINVELVDAGELRSMSTEPSAAASPPPAPPAQAPTPAAEPAKPPEPPEPPQPAEAQTPAEAAPPQEAAGAPPVETDDLQLPAPVEAPKLAPPKPAVKEKAAPKPDAKTAAKPKTKPPSPMDLSMPQDMAMQGDLGGDASSVPTRPPGITRSGENDRYGRDVIRALKRTMPPPKGTLGRVTIRLILNARGNVGQLQLLQSGGNSELDQDVMFSAREAVLPFPPKNSTGADRTFVITYVYR